MILVFALCARELSGWLCTLEKVEINFSSSPAKWFRCNEAVSLRFGFNSFSNQTNKQNSDVGSDAMQWFPPWFFGKAFDAKMKVEICCDGNDWRFA
jgi:hypothetical protein